jgi:hypothetical protein
VTKPLVPCQCRQPGACVRPATQEDFLCDLCRSGCAAVGFAPVGTPADQIPVTAHQPTPTMTWEGTL